MIQNNLPITNPQKKRSIYPRKYIERKTRDNDPKIQLQYYHIFQTKIMMRLSRPETAELLGIDTKKVTEACQWVRDNWEKLSSEEYFQESETFVNGRIRELDRMIQEEIDDGTILINNRTKEVVKGKNGKPVTITDKAHIVKLMTIRSVFDRMLLEVRGAVQAASNIIQNTNTNIVIDNRSTQIETMINNMTPEDKKKFIELTEKYGSQEPTVHVE